VILPTSVGDAPAEVDVEVSSKVMGSYERLGQDAANWKALRVSG